MQTKMLINGELIDGKGEAIDCLNPATGETICTIHAASSEQVDEAAIASDKAFKTYSKTSPAERSALLHAIADKLEEHVQESNNPNPPVTNQESSEKPDDSDDEGEGDNEGPKHTKQ